MKAVTFKLDLFEKIVNRSYEAIIIVDKNRKIVFWNSSAEKIFGFTAEMVIGRDMHSLITPERYRDKANAAHSSYVATGEGKLLGRRVEIEAINCIGQEFWIELSVNNVTVDGQHWAFAIIRDISERKKMEQMLKHQAQTDPLSGLYNRRAFQFYLENTIDNGVSVALIDADKFKQINDTYGHDAGDAVIDIISRNIKSTCTDAICCARMGGDEFAVIISEFNREKLTEQFQKLADQVSDTVSHDINIPNFSLSIGIACDPTGKASIREIMKLADIALYDAKEKNGASLNIRDYRATAI